MRLLKFKAPSSLQTRLILVNVLVLSSFILFSGLTIYQTACFLAGNQKGAMFDQTLLRYFFMVSILAILVGSIIYYKVTKRMMQPMEELKNSLAAIHEGTYPEAIDETVTFDEIKHVIRQFNVMNEKLKQNEEVRNQLLNDLSHELRTPLSNMNGYLEALSKGVIEGNPHVYRILSSETNRITGLLGQIEWVKDWDKAHVELKQEDMSAILEPVVQSFRAAFEKEEVPLRVDLEQVEVSVHKQGIQQVLTNLLSNALRYYKGEGPVTVTGKLEGRSYTVSVSGPGEPIPASSREKIFNRFYRVDASRSRQTGGAGLGLAISKEIVEKHGGTIEVSSIENIHTFCFRIPV
jgi:two-component system sensor histidine kinase BaeS